MLKFVVISYYSAIALLLSLLVVLLCALFGGLIGGFSRKQLTEQVFLFPNEGVRRSVKYGFVGGLLVFLGGLFVGLLGGFLVALVGHVPLLVGVFVGLLVGVSIGIFFGLLAGLFSGLAMAARHALLRFWLWRTHLFPWHAVRFLNDATARILLQRVGGGYRFIHRLLLDHFAELGKLPAEPYLAN